MGLTLQHDVLDSFLKIEALQQRTELRFVSQRREESLNAQLVRRRQLSTEESPGFLPRLHRNLVPQGQEELTMLHVSRGGVPSGELQATEEE